MALLYLGIPVPCNSAGGYSIVRSHENNNGLTPTDRYGSCPDVVFCNGQKLRAEDEHWHK
eukprot:6201625-Pleurochrysis_carterae.AAC.2